MYIKVRVIPGSKKEEVTQRAPDALVISVKERAQQGAATRRARKLVAEHFGIGIDAVRLIKGYTTPGKIFEIPDNLL